MTLKIIFMSSNKNINVDIPALRDFEMACVRYVDALLDARNKLIHACNDVSITWRDDDFRIIDARVGEAEREINSIINIVQDRLLANVRKIIASDKPRL